MKILMLIAFLFVCNTFANANESKFTRESRFAKLDGTLRRVGIPPLKKSSYGCHTEYNYGADYKETVQIILGDCKDNLNFIFVRAWGKSRAIGEFASSLIFALELDAIEKVKFTSHLLLFNDLARYETSDGKYEITFYKDSFSILSREF